MGHAGPVVGADLSEAMLRAARERSGVRVVRADVQALPFRGGCADVVLAMHMLYHVPDIALVLSEARRCLRPDGTLLAATNGRDHLAELHREYRAAVFRDGAMPRPSLRFNLGNGEPLLRACFDEVILHERRVRLSVPEPEPIVAYFDSARSMREKALPAGITWDDALARFEARIRGRIDAEGAMEIHSHVGVWVCH
jgi:SAM-dependent methyltransferase